MTDNTVSNCPKCNEVGHVARHKAISVNVHMECPICSFKWKTLSKRCKKCFKPNGFAVEGFCSSCYSEMYR